TFVGFKLFLILLGMLKELLRSILLLIFGSSPAWLAPISYMSHTTTGQDKVVALSLGDAASWSDRYEVDEADLFDLGEPPPPPVEPEPMPVKRMAAKRMAAKRAMANELVESVGLLKMIGTTGSDGGIASVFGSGGFDDIDNALMGSIGNDYGGGVEGGFVGGVVGGMIGAKGTQYGSGGLGNRGSGIGGGGTAEGLGGLGTRGTGSGASGYGRGAGVLGGSGSPSANTGNPVILGSLDRSQITKVVKRHMNQIRYCYQQELTSNPSLAGRIDIKFVIDKDGNVSQASAKKNTMGNQATEQCIAGRFMRMKFPKPSGSGIVIVRYPFVFAPSS
ncbi:MAG: AgmX/PglI C-terminal domain-containing protein, partial [Proteobacteria bacterium]|nr:AgmX/PglI C-terminal domain-containing protein [Pseudomonadota bacterium]